MANKKGSTPPHPRSNIISAIFVGKSYVGIMFTLKRSGEADCTYITNV